ncbi:response regulator [Quadrisphaera sp. GCM10027208]|uniref:response regulator n=1 Tax=Quadrisphaera sp. GCM10027208 TaxID=3273423 RepID=UPI00361EE004
MTTRVLLVDDHTVVRSGLKTMLDAEPDLEIVGQADGLNSGWRALVSLDPDVLVCDVTMADGSGIDLCRKARGDFPGLGIVVLTMHGDDDTLFAVLDAGASSLVLKSAGLDDVLAAVRQAASSPDVFSAAGLGAAMRRRANDDRPRLTPRETEVLQLLKDGLSIHQVSRRLYLSESTVKTHVAKLYDKLGATNRAQVVMNAVRLKLIPTD